MPVVFFPLPNCKKKIEVDFGCLSAVYRLIELSDGWDGRIISTQVYFSKCIFHLGRCCIYLHEGFVERLLIMCFTTLRRVGWRDGTLGDPDAERLPPGAGSSPQSYSMRMSVSNHFHYLLFCTSLCSPFITFHLLCPDSNVRKMLCFSV